MKIKLILALLVVHSTTIFANKKYINLPKVNKKIGMDLLKAVETRSANRNFSSKKVSMKKLSAILYIGHGIIKKIGNKTTHGFPAVSGATSMNRYTVPFGWETPYLKLYLILKKGAYLYLPESQKLQLISEKNILEDIGIASSNPFGAFIVAANYKKMPGAEKNSITKTAAFMTAGSVFQNLIIAASAYKIQTLTQIQMKKNTIIKKLKMDKKVEPLAILTFGYGK